MFTWVSLPYRSFLEKMFTAFFKMSRSIVTFFNSFLDRLEVLKGAANDRNWLNLFELNAYAMNCNSGDEMKSLIDKFVSENNLIVFV